MIRFSAASTSVTNDVYARKNLTYTHGTRSVVTGGAGAAGASTPITFNGNALAFNFIRSAGNAGGFVSQDVADFGSNQAGSRLTQAELESVSLGVGQSFILRHSALPGGMMMFSVSGFGPEAAGRARLQVTGGFPVSIGQGTTGTPYTTFATAPQLFTVPTGSSSGTFTLTEAAGEEFERKLNEIARGDYMNI